MSCLYRDGSISSDATAEGKPPLKRDCGLCLCGSFVYKGFLQGIPTRYSYKVFRLGIGTVHYLVVIVRLWSDS